MGNYATIAELQTRFANAAEVAWLTDTADTGVPDDDVLTDCVESAEAEINTRLAKRYATPVDTTVDTELARLLKRKALDLAEYFLSSRSDQVSDVVGKKVDRVYEWLAAVTNGDVVLPGAVTPASTASRDPLATWTDTTRTQPSTSGRLWSRESMKQL